MRREIELWTQRSLSLTLVDVPQEADHRRRKKSSETFLFNEQFVFYT